MLSRNYRLRGKDISYISRKKQYFVAGIFSFMYVPQYPQRHYNQFAVHVGLDVSAQSVVRHRVKRIVMAHITSQQFITQSYAGLYYKIFVTCTKSASHDWKKLFAQTDKNTIPPWIIDNFTHSYLLFCKRLCNLSKK